MNYLPNLVTVAGIMAMALVSPGPNFIVVTSTAVSVSRAAGVMSGIGIAAATLTWTMLAIASLHVVAASGEWLYLALRALGAAYLVWLGLAMIRKAREPFKLGVPSVQARDAWVAMRKGYAVSMTNPKAAAFFGSIFAVALPKQAPPWVYLATIAIAVSLSLAWNCSLALFFSNAKVRAGYARGKTAINIAMGLLLIGVGVRMILER